MKRNLRKAFAFILALTMVVSLFACGKKDANPDGGDSSSDDMEKTFDALCNAARRCIEEDGAQCIVLSCLGMAGMGERMTNELKIPVIDPAPVAIKYAEMLAGLGICYSRKAYPSPPDKEII